VELVLGGLDVAELVEDAVLLRTLVWDEAIEDEPTQVIS